MNDSGIKKIATSAMLGLAVALVATIIFPSLQNKITINPDDHAHNVSDRTMFATGYASYSQAVSRAAPSVVNIYTRKVTLGRIDHPLSKHPLFGRLVTQARVPQTSLGSGVIMKADGIILTNHHVIADADKILTMLYDGRTAPVKLVGSDPDTDLAVLKIDLDNLQPISIGKSESAEVGDVVLAIGNPHGIGQTVTQGIISATGRAGLGLNTFENFLQTDAGISVGNSGGALVDLDGNLLGINTASIGNTGSISFAIPSSTAIHVLNEILKHGFVIRGWLGLDAIPVTARLARQLKIPLRHGLLIRAIAVNGPSDNLNLFPGDIVIEINGVSVLDPQTSMTQISKVQPGNPIKLSIWRRGATFSVTAIAGTRPSISPIN
jgi:serine protease DegS|tara:strand:- start:30200 stop:31336 length:1137 start_codon:yes stop_codon:yes gene_type:complete